VRVVVGVEAPSRRFTDKSAKRRDAASTAVLKKVKTMKRILLAVLGLGALAIGARAEMKDVPHPFLLWTKEEAAAIRKQIETDPLAKQQYDKMASTEISKGNPTIWNLFRYLVMGDEAAAQREKDELLTPEERAGVEKSLRTYIQFHLEGAKPQHPDFHYTRMGWLPNMHWPRPIGTHLMAVALRDEKLIVAMFNSEGGWKWFFDDYITDGRFYNEEFCKYYSNIGTMLLYCEALEHLGLSQFGYGYTGKGGATMKNFLQMPIKVGFPRLAGDGMPVYPGVTMGDAGAFAVFNVPKKGGTVPQWWSTSNMNGPFPKLQAPGWYEIGHARWPDAGFGYFLGQMRQPGEDVCLPSLYFGAGPIDPKKAAPPPHRPTSPANAASPCSAPRNRRPTGNRPSRPSRSSSGCTTCITSTTVSASSSLSPTTGPSMTAWAVSAAAMPAATRGATTSAAKAAASWWTA
jgi:hypothetical protein